MSIKLTSSNGQVAYDVNEYVVDTPDEIQNLPKKCGMGSTAIVISTSEVFMKNGRGEWVKM